MKKTITAILLLLACSCQKEKPSPSTSPSLSATQPENLQTYLPPAVQTFANTYGLKLYTSNTTWQAFSDTASAGKYVRNKLAAFAQIHYVTLIGGGTITPSYRACPSPQPEGNVRAIVGGPAGLFSSFTIEFYIGPNNSISHISITVSGMPVGWSWTAANTFYGTTSACVSGNILWGVRVFGYPLGIPQRYNFHIWADNCGVYLGYGANACY